MLEADTLVEHIAKIIELAGVAIIVCAIALAAVLFVTQGVRAHTWREAYERLPVKPQHEGEQNP